MSPKNDGRGRAPTQDQPVLAARASKPSPAAAGAAAGRQAAEALGLGRRAFLRGAGAGTAAAIAAGIAGRPAAALAGGAEQSPASLETVPSDGSGSMAARRREAAYHYRVKCAQIARSRPQARSAQRNNGDEELYAERIGNYSKGLPHDSLGAVDPDAYDALLAALRHGEPEDFERIPLAGERKLVSPQAGLAFELEGADPQALRMPAAPAFASAQAAGEMVELYWMALLRDLPFERYGSSRHAAAAARDLSRLSDFRGPKSGGQVTPETLFRGFTAGDLVGPYVSQLLLHPIPYGSLTIDQRQRTTVAEIDFMTSFDDWLAMQNGALPPVEAYDPTPRYPRNMRDLTAYVHVDALYEAYLNACLILLGWGAPTAAGLPPASSQTWEGFAEFGGPHILSMVTEVATRALKAVWWQKWFVHRRLRPEEYGGRVHAHLAGQTSYPLHADVLDSEAIDAVAYVHGSHLLPMAFPEGCPLHPSYGSGHGTVAGACVTVLKAFFDEGWVLPDPVVASDDGTELLAWDGAELTVGGELNKVGANIATGRNGAGLHWRSDYAESLRLGEQVAIGILEEQKLSYNQSFEWRFTSFDGEAITI